MDRLLRYCLQQFIRRGAMNFTTASGAKFSCGDGTGQPVSARFLTTEAERRVLLNPELALGEVYMEGTFVVENGTIADALAILMDQPDMLPRWARLQWWLRYLVRHLRQINLREPLERQRRASLRSRRTAVFPVPRRRQAVQLRLFRNAGRNARRCPARQETPSCRQAPDRARQQRARHRLRLGRTQPLSGGDDRGQCHRHHAVDRTVAGVERARGREKSGRRNSSSRTIAT